MNSQYIFPMIYEFLVMGMILLLDYKMYKRYREKNQTKTVKYMLLYTSSMTLAILASAISRVIRVTIWDLTLTTGNLEFLVICVSFIGLGNVFYLLFLLEVFFIDLSERKRKLYIIIYSILAIFNAILAISTGLYVIDLPIFVWIYLIIISAIVNLICIVSALRLAKRIKESLAKNSIILIGLSGFFVILQYIFFMTEAADPGDFTIFYIIAWIMTIFAIWSLYLGVIQPDWYKKRANSIISQSEK